MASTKKAAAPARSPTEVREILLRYFYDRNQQATSARGKQGFSVKIMDVRKELKAQKGLSQQEVIGNLNYLISQGWLAEEHIEKSVPLASGSVIPQSTSFFKITSHGIDKMEGPGAFTMDKFSGIKIEATGQNIITVGDGNVVDASFGDLGSALSDLRKAVVGSAEVSEAQKLDAVADIDSMESQLAKREPNGSILAGAWDGIKKLNTVLGLAERVAKVGALVAPLLS